MFYVRAAGAAQIPTLHTVHQISIRHTHLNLKNPKDKKSLSQRLRNMVYQIIEGIEDQSIDSLIADPQKPCQKSRLPPKIHA